MSSYSTSFFVYAMKLLTSKQPFQGSSLKGAVYTTARIQGWSGNVDMCVRSSTFYKLQCRRSRSTTTQAHTWRHRFFSSKPILVIYRNKSHIFLRFWVASHYFQWYQIDKRSLGYMMTSRNLYLVQYEEKS